MACHGQAPRGASEPPEVRVTGRDPQIAKKKKGPKEALSKSCSKPFLKLLNYRYSLRV